MIHERFCCNRLPVRASTQAGRFAALGREAAFGSGVASFRFQVSSCSFRIAEIPVSNLKPET